MYGGDVLGGTCPNGGGAIYGANWDSRVNILGGKVTGNENEEAPGVRLYGTKNVIENATVTGGVEINSFRFDGADTKPINQLTLKSGAKVDSILIADLTDVRANGSGNYTILPLLTVNGTLTDAITISTFNEEPHVFSATAVDASVLSDVIIKCGQYGNAVTSLPYNEQIFVVDDEISTVQYIPRETLRRVSTPQAYKYGKLNWAYHKAFAEEIGIYGSAYTNTMMVQLGVKLHFAAGSDKNIKLTTKDDLELFKAYLKADKDNWLK